MGPTIDELNKILEIKNNIKQSIINKGVEITDNTKFADYPSKIDNIEVGGGGDSVWSTVTNNWTRFEYLFHNCKALTELDLSNWNTSNGTDMRQMFYNCTKLTSLDVSNWDTSNVTSMYSMFYGCSSLTSLDVSNFDTSNVTDMRSMFQYCSSLTKVNTSNWDTSKVTNMSNMFSYCNKLTSLDMSNCDVSKCTSSTSINSIIGVSSSNGCPNLTDFKAPKNINANITVSASPLLTHDSLMSIINNLATISGKTLTLGATNLAKLTADEIAIATNKGWKIA